MRPVGGRKACVSVVRFTAPIVAVTAFISNTKNENSYAIEQGMVVARDVSHEDAHLAVIDLAPVATPLALDPHRMRAALGEAAGIEGDDAIGFAQPLGHLSD